MRSHNINNDNIGVVVRRYMRAFDRTRMRYARAHVHLIHCACARCTSRPHPGPLYVGCGLSSSTAIRDHLELNMSESQEVQAEITAATAGDAPAQGMQEFLVHLLIFIFSKQVVSS